MELKIEAVVAASLPTYLVHTSLHANLQNKNKANCSVGAFSISLAVGNHTRPVPPVEKKKKEEKKPHQSAGYYHVYK
jgi:hypothetical protein